MSHGFNNDKTKGSEIEQAISTAVSNAVASLRSAIRDYWETIYPVGSIYITTSNDNPSVLFGGRWEAYGQGKVLVGIQPGDTNFNAVGKTGGSKSQTIHIDWEHSHDVLIDGVPGTHSPLIFTGAELDGTSSQRNYVITPQVPATAEDVAPGKLQDIPVRRVVNPLAAGTVGGTQSETQTINKLMPYITVRMWRRIA